MAGAKKYPALWLFMCSPMQRKYAARAAHGARVEQERKPFPVRLKYAKTEKYVIIVWT